MDENTIIIYTDGACFGNPGPGGYGAVLLFKGKRKEISGGFRLTTNNRMELLAAVEALKALKSTKYKIKLYSDSRLLVNAINLGWLKKWKALNWTKNRKEKVINPDLWAELDQLINGLDIEFIWIEAHIGIVENERCDKLSKEAASQANLPADEVYENSKS